MGKNQINVSGNARLQVGNLVVGDGAQLTAATGARESPATDSSDDKHPRVFLSYRRSDSGDVTGRIYDRLITHYGKGSVFRDIDSIPLAVPYPQHLEEVIRNVDAVLVIVGPEWITVTNEYGQPRLFEPDDYVRKEVETALRCAVPVFPLTIAGARKPRVVQLPESIQALATRQGFSIRSDPDFHRDMDALLQRLERLHAGHSS